MSDKIEVMEGTNPATAENAAAEPAAPAYTVEYILAQMAEISKQTNQMTNTIREFLHNLEDDDAALPKMGSLNDMVKQREKTSQKMLELYESMYDKLAQQDDSQRVVSRLDAVSAWMKTLNREEYNDECWQALMNAAMSQMCRP